MTVSGDQRLTIQRLDAEGLRRLDRSNWDRLARSALVENPFYAAQQVLAAIDTIDSDLAPEAFAVKDGAGRLVGLFPFSRRNRSRYPLPTSFGSANDFQFSGTPLVDRDRAADVVALWLDDLKRGVGRRPWVFRHFPVTSPLGRLIAEGAAARGFEVRQVLPYKRAVLTRLDGGFEAHLSTVLSKNRLKDVRRTMRRLAELGPLVLEHAEAPEAVNARLEDFLTLEHSGWKREQGSSILSDPANAEFFRRAHRASDDNRGFVVIDSLLLDGRPIAMKLSIRQGQTAFTPKIAYDETYRKLGPGMALEYKLLEAFYASSEPAAIDAAATVDGHSALNFFNEQHDMAVLMLGASRWQVRLLALAYEGRQKLAEWRAARRKGAPAAEPAGQAETADPGVPGHTVLLAK